MPVSSMQIQQMMMQQQAMFASNMAYSQQIGAPMQQAMGMQSPSPWSAPAYSMQRAAAPYGERMAMGMASFGANVAAPTMMGAGALMGGMGMLGAAGHLFDPFGSALSGGAAGFARGGVMGAMGGAAMGALPGYLAMKAADVYGGAFMGGVRDQSGINQMMRSNFNFYGGQGAGGRGFSQAQMGQVGNALQNTASRDLTTSLQELTQLTQMGAQSGQFNGVRDVQQFTAKFKQMLTSLKTIQTELGGTLTDAMAFTQTANRNGVFRNLDSYAAQMRTAQGATGMSQAQLAAMSEQGAGLSQSMGGRRAQGARGALRMATSLGAAYSGGIINDEALQEATGAGGAEGLQALTGRLMEHTAQFSRRAMGRYSIFGMSNARGTGLDENAVNAMMSGSTSAGDLSRAAHRNVRGMGRGRAINNEGMLRGALLEQGGLAGQIGLMRMSIGDRVLDQGDDVASLFMQRRMRMSRPEAEIMTSLMRNQGAIAQEEATTRRGTRLETSRNREIQEHRSMDAFFANMGHALEEGTGVTTARDAGRRFVTRMSQLSEKVMNRLLGVAENEMSTSDRSTMNRYSMGAATQSDRDRISSQLGALTRSGGGGMLNLQSQGLFESGPSVVNQLNSRGLNYGTGERVDSARAYRDIAAIEDARRGRVTGTRDIQALARMSATTLMNAQVEARGAHERTGASQNASFYAAIQRMGGTANAADAFQAQNGMTQFAGAPTAASLMDRTPAAAEARGRGYWGRVAATAAGGAAVGAGVGSIGAGIGAIPGAVIGGLVGGIGGMFTSANEPTRRERLINDLASGGNLRRELEYNAEHHTRTGASRGRGGGMTGQDARNRTRDLNRAEGLQVDSEAMKSVVESQDFKDRLQRMQGMQGQTLNQELERMALWASQGGTPEETAARQSLVSQMQRSTVTNHGRLGSRFTQAAGADRGTQEAMLRSVSDRGSFLSRMGGGFAQAGAYLSSVQGYALGTAGEGAKRPGETDEAHARRTSTEGFRNRMGQMTQRQFAAGEGGAEAEMRRMAGMSHADLTAQLNTYRENLQGGPRRSNESEEAYNQRVSSSMSASDTESYQAMSREAYRRQGVSERLSGRGRRGRAGARDEAFQQITGGNVTEGITLGTGRNQRTVTGRNAIMQLLRRGAGREGSEETSAEFQAAARQLYEQSGSQGGEAQFANLLRDTTRAGGKLSPELQTRIEAAGRDPGVSARRQEALAAQQRARDPLGQQQVDLLRQINEGIRGIPGNTGDVPPADA